MKVLFVTVRFPNRIQPWFANTVAQVVINGGDVKLLTTQSGDKDAPKVVDQYGLRKATQVVGLYGVSLLFQAIKNILNPFSYPGIIKSLKMFSTGNKGSKVHRLKGLLRLIALSHCFNLDDISLVHSHSEVAGYKMLPVVKALNVPFVVTFHGLTPPGVPGITPEMRKEYTELADLILLNTEFAKKQYIGLGADEKKIRVLPQGTDIKRFAYKKRASVIDRCIELLSIGRLSSDKGHEYTIQAVHELLNKNIDVRLNIVGQGPDKQVLYDQVSELNLKDRVTIESGLSEDDLLERYHRSDIFILSSTTSKDGSHEETQGVVLQEAQATGAIVIATRVGGIPECIDDGVNGFLIEERNSDQITEKVLWLADNPEHWEQVRTNARKHVEENYSMDLIGKRLYQIYESLTMKKNTV